VLLLLALVAGAGLACAAESSESPAQLGATAAPDPQLTLSNAAVSATFTAGRLVSLARASAEPTVDSASAITVGGDDFSIELLLPNGGATATTTVLSSANFSGSPELQPGANASSLALLWRFKELSVEVRYSLVSPTASFVEKQVTEQRLFLRH
jgi:hypothetical protein